MERFWGCSWRLYIRVMAGGILGFKLALIHRDDDCREILGLELALYVVATTGRTAGIPTDVMRRRKEGGPHSQI